MKEDESKDIKKFKIKLYTNNKKYNKKYLKNRNMRSLQAKSKNPKRNN
jgi:hypothetical protein